MPSLYTLAHNINITGTVMLSDFSESCVAGFLLHYMRLSGVENCW